LPLVRILACRLVVYDVTKYAPTHPVGPELVYEDCGKDGTDHYSIFHPQSLLITITSYALGNVTGQAPDTQSKSPNPVPVKITMEEVALHNTSSDCWVRYYDEVYDLTYYSHPPPGQSVILDNCGTDGTSNYVSVHPRDLLQKVEKYYLGQVSGSFSDKRIVLSLCLGFFVSGINFI
jgi:cytochrome b involved in lipid metabolism